MPELENPADVASLTVQLLSAYLANNTVGSEDLPALIRATRQALTEDAAPEAPAIEEVSYTPAVSVRRSLSSPSHILSLIDGKPYKTLKRHLTSHGLTPDTYRQRYGLADNYPMVAPEFAAMRRAIAEKIGLGTRADTAKDRTSAPVPAMQAPSKPEAAAAPVDAGSVAAQEGTSKVAVPAKARRRKPIAKPASKPVKRPAAEAPVQTAVPSVDETVAAAPSDAASVKPEAASPTVAKAKRTRKAPTTGKDIAGVPAPAVAAPAPGAPSGSSAAAKGTPKGARKAKVTIKAEAGPDEAVVTSVPGSDGAAQVTAPETAPVKARAKQRGKLGLFGKGRAPGPVGAPSVPVDAEKPIKAAKRKRMARQPKDGSTEAG